MLERWIFSLKLYYLGWLTEILGIYCFAFIKKLFKIYYFFILPAVLPDDTDNSVKYKSSGM